MEDYMPRGQVTDIAATKRTDKKEISPCQQLLEELLAMPRHDDVVIANGVGEEIAGGETLVGQQDDLLRATEVWLGLVANEGAFGNEVAREVARELEDSICPYGI